MPLIQGKSPKAFEHNLKAEMHSGKPQKQSLAIAYAVKKRNQKARGGMIHEPMHKEELEAQQMCAHGGPVEECYMHGGEMHNPKLMEAHKMAKGGMVDKEDGTNEIGWDLDPEGRDLDLMNAEDDFDVENSPSDEQVHNEFDNPMGESEEESGPLSKPKKSKLLGRILGALSQTHMPSRF